MSWFWKKTDVLILNKDKRLGSEEGRMFWLWRRTVSWFWKGHFSYFEEGQMPWFRRATNVLVWRRTMSWFWEKTNVLILKRDRCPGFEEGMVDTGAAGEGDFQIFKILKYWQHPILRINPFEHPQCQQSEILKCSIVLNLEILKWSHVQNPSV